MSPQTRLRRQLGIALLISTVLTLGTAARALATATVTQPKANGATQKADGVEPPAAAKAGIPIYPSQSAARSHPVVVYSVYAPKLASNERVHIAGSNHISYCTSADIDPATGDAGSPCKGLVGGTQPDSYTYTLHLEIHAYQASSATAKSSGQPSGWLASTERLCTWHYHHCAFTVKNNLTGLAARKGQYINQEVTAWTDSPDWESGQMVELESNCINGTTLSNCNPQPNNDQQTLSKGQLSVVRMGRNYGGSVTIPTDGQFTQNYILINTSGTFQKQVVYSRPIYGVDAGDVIETSAGVQLDGTQPCAPDYCTLNGSSDPTYVFQHAIEGEWLLANSPTHKSAGSGERWISGSDVQNCQAADGTGDGLCRLQMMGAVTAPTPPEDRTMYLNFVALAKDSSGEGPSTNGIAPKVTLSSGQFDATCNPSLFPDSGALCRFSP